MASHLSTNVHCTNKKPGILHRLFFTWLFDLLKLGAQRPLTQDDLYPLQDEYKAETIVQKLEETWSQELNSANKEGRQPKLWKAVMGIFPIWKKLTLIFLQGTQMCTTYVLVVVLWLFYGYLQGESHMEMWYPPLLVLGITICTFVKVFCYHQFDYMSLVMGMQLKVAVMGMVYKKILSTNCSRLQSITAGSIMNLMSNDVKKLEKLIMSAISSVVSFLSFLTAAVLLWAVAGWQSLSGIMVLLLYLFYQVFMLKKYRTLSFKQANATDHRLAAVKDLISGIRAVKMHTLEWKYSDIIETLRRNEIRTFRLQGITYILPVAIYPVLTPLVTLVSMATLLYYDVHINVVDVFTIMSLYSVLNFVIAMNWSLDFLDVVNGLTAITRFQIFFTAANDIKPSIIQEDDCNKKEKKNIFSKTGIIKCIQRLIKSTGKESKKPFKNVRYSTLPNSDTDTTQPYEGDSEDVQPNVRLRKVSAGWFEDDKQCTLHDITFATEPNQLIMVTGPVGSGKSTLLMVILEEIPIKSGNISSHGKIAYVSQHPWIFTGTVRDNILFGQDFEENRYQRVLDVCDLYEDINRFPKGDMSMTGQRGVSLSGGQRVRVSLARAVYSNADIYLLDDPLSALDVKVGHYVLDECICKELSSRVRILVTHQLQHLHRADNIFIMKEGTLLAHGSYEQLTSHNWIEDFLESALKFNDLEDKVEDGTKKRCELMAREGKDMAEEEEERTVGSVTWHVYWEYFRASLPSLLIVCFVLFYLAVQVTVVAPSWWLSRIAKLPHLQHKSPTSLGVLAILVATAFALCLTKECFLFNILINASKNLNHKMTLAVLKSPVLFFDTNPMGRILNRFSKDIGCMDRVLPKYFVVAAALCTNALGVVVLALLSNIWFVFIVVPLCFLFYCICRYYLSAARDLQRMEAINCSPIYAHTAETIAGIEVVRTSRMQENFVEKMFRYQDEYTQVFYLVTAVSRWFGFYIDLLCAAFVSSFPVLSLITGEDKALAVMILTLSLSLLGFVQFGAKDCTRVENFMTSVERVLAYIKLSSEPGYDRNTQPPDEWPTNGALTLRNVSLTYCEGGPRVLKDISLDVKPAEKLGIAGRTGAGKSSLVASLFRMPDPEGHVFIDGVDLGTINLQDARRSMAVITQDPVLFIGSLRKNLDPFDKLTDLQLWTALEEVQLKQKVLSLDGQLEYPIGEGGSGLSAGQRQLLCLARALLQRCKILVLDEATANIDYQTDQMIQQTLRNKFTNCTVLTIAHRLNTIVDYDKVIVLEDGRVVEHDDPRVLVEKPNSIFAHFNF